MSLILAAYTRIRQGARAITSHFRPVDERLAREALSPVEWTLFRRLRRGERQHSLNVLRTLIDHPPPQSTLTPDLATAALLHDVGKSRCPLPLWEKSLTVILRAISPTTFRRFADAGDLRHPIARACVVYAHHPTWSAEMMRAAFSSPDAIWLAEHHADNAVSWRTHPLHAALVALQYADDMN